MESPDSWESILRVANDLTVVGLLAFIIIAMIRGWIVTGARFEDMKGRADKAEDRVERLHAEVQNHIRENADMKHILATLNQNMTELIAVVRTRRE